MTTPFNGSIPKDLVTHVTAICGAKGELWFEELPSLITKLEEKWRLRVNAPFSGIEYNFVAPAKTHDGRDVVIKIAPPFEDVEINGEAKWLREHNGVGVVRLIEQDRQRKAILIERAFPGEALFERFKDQPLESVLAAIKILQETLLPPPADMTDVDTLDHWFENFRRFDTTEFPAEFALPAFEIYERLSKQAEHIFYLHGDFHPGNVVTATREPFLVIDPKGIVGHIGYDISVFLINLHRWQGKSSNVLNIVNEAIKHFSNAFDIPEHEIREWTFATNVIGAWWNFDDMPDLYDAKLAMPAIWHL